jgi:ribosomal protein S18 acetylase RimI-like enzyme
MNNFFSIVPLSSNYINKVANIHSESLPNDFLPNLGLDFLINTFYPAALESNYGKVFIALENETNPVGFILVTLDSGSFLKGIIKDRFIDFLKIGLRSSFSSPNNLFSNLQIIISGLFSNTSQDTGEIYIVAVSESARGKGIGKYLVERSITFMQECNIKSLGIKTLASNKEWIEFFNKIGWRIEQEFRLIGNDYVWLVTHI